MNPEKIAAWLNKRNVNNNLAQVAKELHDDMKKIVGYLYFVHFSPA